MNTKLVAAMMLALAATPALSQGTRIEISLEMDADASARLIKAGEWVIVSAYYMGDPATPDAPLNEIGQVYLGAEELTIYPVSQTIILGGSLGSAPRDWVTEPYVNVNVFTARLTHENNLLDCGIVDDALSVVTEARNVISCKWLGE